LQARYALRANNSELIPCPMGTPDEDEKAALELHRLINATNTRSSARRTGVPKRNSSPEQKKNERESLVERPLLSPWMYLAGAHCARCAGRTCYEDGDDDGVTDESSPGDGESTESEDTERTEDEPARKPRRTASPKASTASRGQLARSPKETSSTAARTPQASPSISGREAGSRKTIENTKAPKVPSSSNGEPIAAHNQLSQACCPTPCFLHNECLTPCLVCRCKHAKIICQ
jgi:hypothetical protein